GRTCGHIRLPLALGTRAPGSGGSAGSRGRAARGPDQFAIQLATETGSGPVATWWGSRRSPSPRDLGRGALTRETQDSWRPPTSPAPARGFRAKPTRPGWSNVRPQRIPRTLTDLPRSPGSYRRSRAWFDRPLYRPPGAGMPSPGGPKSRILAPLRWLRE